MSVSFPRLFYNPEHAKPRKACCSYTTAQKVATVIIFAGTGAVFGIPLGAGGVVALTATCTIGAAIKIICEMG